MASVKKRHCIHNCLCKMKLLRTKIVNKISKIKYLQNLVKKLKKIYFFQNKESLYLRYEIKYIYTIHDVLA
jgi:hypothetical protein